ncbi:nuclease-related domain-containing protein [Kineococcus sp. SYSU DK006]|uniref:nuclease-related domain-containing protein n=1 Tax=Kineococcus sp. SYSU DK006 TaxID=3383127 RepID=UPI003D7CD29F
MTVAGEGVAGQGVAGGGAAEQARRSADRVADLRRQLAAAEQRQRAWEAGAEGERLVAAELDALTSAGWSVLHDVRWPGRQRANLDHVLIGPAGVVVVDSKNWTGRVSVRDGVLRAGSHRKDREVEGVAAAAAAVAALLPPEDRTAVRAVLCLVQQDLPAQTSSAQVVVVGRARVQHLLRSLPPALTADQVRRTTERLRPNLGAPPAAPSRTRSTPARRGAGRRTSAGDRLFLALVRVAALACLAVVVLAWASPPA